MSERQKVKDWRERSVTALESIAKSLEKIANPVKTNVVVNHPANLESCDIVLSDPSFQVPKAKSPDVMAMCKLATTIYKNTEFVHQVQPAVFSLLAQVPVETLETAIEKVSQMFDNNNRPHDKRPNFARQFNSAKAVREMAEREVTVPEKDWLS